MKKYLFCLYIILFTYSLFSEKLPDKLTGIWEAKDRYIFFEENDEAEPQLVVILKTYYGWYFDRAAEPASYSEKESRTRNTATARKAENIIIQNIDFKESNNSLYGSLELFYSKWQKNIVPLFLLDDSIYLNYFVLDENENQELYGSIRNSQSKNQNYKFYRGIAPSKGFTISTNSLPKDITGYIIDGEKLYDVRYWYTDMDYSTDYINFNYNEDYYLIPKHLSSCQRVYTCVSGRSKNVRNTVKPFDYIKDDYLFNDEEKVFAKNEEPYLKRLADKATFEDLMQIVKTANSRRKPEPPTLFPESNLDWHWDLIDLLEKDNKLIQEARARQKAFGPRGRDE